MADEPQPSGTQAEPTGQPQAGGTQANPGKTQPQDTPQAGGKRDELESLSPSELAKMVKDLRKEAGGYRTKLSDYEKEEQRRKDAELSEIEKRDKRIAELEPQVTAAQQRERDYALRDAIGEVVGTKEFPATLAPGVTAGKVLRFLDTGAVEWSDKGEPTNVKALLAGLAKSDAYLFARQRVASADGGAGGAVASGHNMNSLIRAAAGRE